MRAFRLVLGLWALGVPTAVLAQVPTTIGYNGVLMKDGAGFSHAGLAMTFKLHDAEVDDSVVWWEDHPAVPVDAGFYHVELGSTDAQKAIDLRMQVAGDRWLEVSVGDNIGVLSPRVKLSAVPFAVTAGTCGDAASVQGKGIADAARMAWAVVMCERKPSFAADGGKSWLLVARVVGTPRTGAAACLSVGYPNCGGVVYAAGGADATYASNPVQALGCDEVLPSDEGAFFACCTK